MSEPPDHLRASLKPSGLVWVWAAWVLALLVSGCSSTSPQSDGRAIQTPTSSDAAYHPQRNDLALFALSLLDTPYSWGGRGPATGFDCSGLVSHVYREATGLPVRGSSADLGRKIRPVDRSRILPGDLVFFNTLGARHSHVGIYVGAGRFVHASNPRTGVRVDHLSNRYYAQRFEGAGSLLD
jgi:hypothetical protein